MSWWDAFRKGWANRESKATRTAAATYNTWQRPPTSTFQYDKVSKEAYGGNEVFYACVEEICTAVAEPRVVAFMDDKPLDTHPIVDLLNKPNPHMSRGQYVGTMALMRSLSGNHYTEIVPNDFDEPIELWNIRPDWMTVIPDPRTKIAGYRMQAGSVTVDYPLREIGHYRTRNPLSEFYGMAPVQVLLSRIDTDNFAREFTKAFFYNAAVPSGLLTFKAILQDDERDIIRRAFNRQFGGGTLGWHNTMVAEENEAHYQPMGMPLGQRGIAYPDLDEIEEARIAMVMGVPLTLIGARLGMNSSSYANRVSDRESFWDETVVPILVEIQDEWNRWLVPRFSGVTEVKFDLSTIEAFAEETDAVHARVRNNVSSGLVSIQKGRQMIGELIEPQDDEVFLVPSNLVPVTWGDLKKANMPMPQQQPFGGGTGDRSNENGRKPPVAMPPKP